MRTKLLVAFAYGAIQTHLNNLEVIWNRKCLSGTSIWALGTKLDIGLLIDSCVSPMALLINITPSGFTKGPPDEPENDDDVSINLWPLV